MVVVVVTDTGIFSQLYTLNNFHFNTKVLESLNNDLEKMIIMDSCWTTLMTNTHKNIYTVLKKYTTQPTTIILKVADPICGYY